MRDEMTRRVVITGMGAVCGNAADPRELEKNCALGVRGFQTCDIFDASMLLTDQFGEVPWITGENRLYELIRISCRQMLESARLTPAQIRGFDGRCRMFYGTLLSTSDTYLRHSQEKSEGRETGRLALMNEYASYAAELTGVQGVIDVSSAACASGTTAVGMAFDFIRNGLCDCAVAGGADALTELAAYGFHALKSLSHTVCAPYDESHDGITIGECGAFFLLESLEHAKARNAQILCEVAGYATGNDAYHITSPEPEGMEAAHVMHEAVKDAGVSLEDIDYINGHGTGTILNDTMETKAVRRLFGEGIKPHVSSTKALVGHCMGASGAIELASVIGMMNGNRPAKMPGLKDPLDGEQRFVVPEQLDIRCALSNSFGFAGNSACLVVKKMEESS